MESIVTSGNAVAVTYKIVLGATTLLNTANASTAVTDRIVGKICNNAGVQNAQVSDFFGAGGTAIFANTTGTSAENLATSLALTITANEANPNTVTPKKWTVELITQR